MYPKSTSAVISAELSKSNQLNATLHFHSEKKIDVIDPNPSPILPLQWKVMTEVEIKVSFLLDSAVLCHSQFSMR
jgi:hypothetical protein